MATKSPSLAYKHWQRIIQLWPIDPVRPQTISFQHVMQQRLSKLHPNPSPSSISSSSSSPSPSTSQPSPNTLATSIKSNGALVSAVPPTPGLSPSPSPSSTSAWNEPHELRQVNALYSLLENRYTKASPTPASLRRPSSDPDHYDVLVRELEEAPKRSWLGALVKRVKGSLRFS